MAADPAFADYVIEQLEDAGAITHRAMFGGYGIWESGDMFALISSDSTLYFKVDDETRPRYQAAGSEQFRTMPYWSVPADLLEDREQLLDWAEEAVAVGHATASKKRR
ncbi:MAG: TfoX/Sxy family protein [Thermomicrobiales bacterium]